MLPPDPNRTPQTPLRSRSFVREIGRGMDRPSVRAPMLTPLGTRAPVGQAAAPPAAMPSVAMSSPALPLARPSLARPGAAPRPNRAAGPTYRGLPKWLRYVLWVVAALAIGAVIGATAPTALMRLGAVAALQPGLLAWYTARTLGFLAYLVVAGSVLYGLLLSTKILDAIATLGGREAQEYLSFVAETHDDAEIRAMAKAAIERLSRRSGLGQPTK